ncbi:hypothetical protein LTR08_008478 [Meristemomyces frigidus]|nr:hypothetical protein LTR08_008478 [Meristemomyces frigidus]
MSTTNTTKQLHWTQRVALIRHNLHSASRSGDFGFFRALQAAYFVEGMNYAAMLEHAIGDDADVVLAAVDSLNAGLAYVHQDAFINVYYSLKDNMRDETSGDEDKSKLYVDIAMQKNMAGLAIDKMTSSAIALINQQPESVRDCAANVWVVGATIVADTLDIALREMDSLDYKMDDYIRLEESWNTVKASVAGSIMGIKGVFYLMDPTDPQTPDKPSPRSASIASAGSAIFRRMSNAFAATSNPAASPTTRNSSVASTNSVSANLNVANFARNGSMSSVNSPVYHTPNYVRNSVSAGCPTSMPAWSGWDHHKLDMVPPTPAFEEPADPFDTSVPLPTMPAIPAMVALPGEQEYIGTMIG